MNRVWMKPIYAFFLISLVVFIASCKKPNELEVYSQWDVLSVGADKALTQLHGTKIFSVEWPYTNGCQSVNKFTVEENGRVIVVKTYGKENEGICTQDAGVKTATWNYTFHHKGNFEFLFMKLDGTYHSIQVEIK